MYVVTVDQQDSRRSTDQVAGLLERLARHRRSFVRAFERTAGDEVQGVLADPAEVVRLLLDLVREGRWSIGVGIGRVREPLPESTRAGQGAAFTLARDAVTRAKTRPTRLAVRGELADSAERAQAALDLVGSVVQRRSAPGWEAVDLADQGLTQAEIGQRLGITKQAVSQRLRAAEWHLDPPGRALAAFLLSEADGRVSRS